MNAALELGDSVGKAVACRALGVPRATLYRRMLPSLGHKGSCRSFKVARRRRGSGRCGNPAALAGFPSEVGKSRFWTFPRSGIFHRPIHHFRLRAKLFDTKLSHHLSQNR
jgi:hypothetical protein